MQTISINFIEPQGWQKLSDKQLRFVYQFLAGNFATDEIKTLCLLRWSGTKVINQQDSGAYLLKKRINLFEVTPLPSLSCCRISTGSARYQPCLSESPKSTARVLAKLILVVSRLRSSSSANPIKWMRRGKAGQEKR